MLFNSFNFLVFFPIVTILYFILPYKSRWFMLLIASCIFYMYFVPWYILILLSTIIIDYVAGILIAGSQGKTRKRYLFLSIIANVGILVFFKYFNFFTDNLNALSSLLGWNYSISALKIILPIGLSFHTFQAMSYTIEVYRGNQPAEKHFGIYALYVMYYPQLVAGPIERPQNLLHQFHTNHTFKYDLVSSGLKQMLWGFFKKLVIADRLSSFVDQVYDAPQTYEGITLFIAAIFFAFQIYCDFSGYSDIALGASRVMGIELMKNFSNPFSSKSITEFWRRWHISLSTWFNDYVFMPLNLHFRNFGKAGISLALFITFFLSGLWHGAGWNFIIYGCMHGIALIYELYTKKQRKTLSSAIHSFTYNKLSVFLTFSYVSISWVFFRVKDINTGFYILKKIFIGIPLYIFNTLTRPDFLWLEPLIFNKTLSSIGMDLLVLTAPILLLILVSKIESKELISNYLKTRSTPLSFLFYFFLILNILLLGVFHNGSEFIYFQF